MNANAAEQQQPTDESGMPADELGPGGALREMRERKGLDVLSVANRLNLHRNVIEALEADDFDSLPEAIFVRGYLRNYARLLGLPAEVMIARYENFAGIPSIAPTGTQSARIRMAGEEASGGSRTLLWLLLVLLLAAGGGGGFLWWQENMAGGDPVVTETPPPELPEPAELAEEGGAPEILSLPMEYTEGGAEAPADAPEEAPVEVPEAVAEDTPVVEVAADQAAGEEAAVEEAPPAEAEVEPVEEEAPAEVAAEPAVEEVVTSPVAEVETESETGSESETTAGAPRTQLVANFTEDCWSEITDGEGTKLFFGIAKAGRPLSVEGVTPIRVLFGRAHAVTLEVDGLPFDIAPYTTANIVKATLGEIDPEADAAAAAGQ